MDRRDALKKLGVGGAVAVAGPVLLDSFNVASASSTAYPPADNDIVLSVADNGINGVRIILDNPSTSPRVFPADTTFSWTMWAGGGNNVSVTPAGDDVTVDRPGSNAPSVNFVVRMIATSTNVGGSATYYIQWTGSSSFNVSPTPQL